MFSPASQRKGPFGTAKNSPRKQIHSPSDRSPFSYSTETLNLFGTPSNDGFIPMSVSRGGDGLSLPRTPVSSGSGSLMPGGARSLSLGSRSVGGGASVCGSAGSGGGAAGGRTMREYDEGLRDLKKENFNLKLRIYFLEERLGKVPGGGGGDRLAAETPTGENPRDSNSVMDLKIQVESLKYDVQEKTDLLQEAGLALEQLENKISRMTIEREEEKSRLETRLQQMEDDLNDSQIKLFDEEEQVKLRGGQSRASSSPIASSGPDANKDEDDEKLLREVEAEMSRRLPYDQSARPAPPALMLPLSGSNSCDSLMAPMRPTHLAVVEERAAAEAEVEELGQALRLSEECLEEARHEVQQRLKDMIALESELVNRDIQITSLKDELTQTKGDLSCVRSAHSEELSLLARERDAGTARLEDAEGEAELLKERIRDADKENEMMRSQMSIMGTQVDDLQSMMSEKDVALARLQNEFGPSLTPRCPDSTDPSHFSIHTHQLTSTSSTVSGGRLQVVTQNLHIPPNSYSLPNQSEVDRLKNDIKKLRDYLKTSVQERKLLLRKIGTLNERLVKAGAASEATPGGIGECGACGESCAVIDGHGGGAAPRFLLLRIANLQQRLANSCEDADVLRSQLEMVVEALAPTLQNAELAAATKAMIERSRDVARSVSRAPTPLVVEAVNRDSEALSLLAEQERKWKRLSVGSAHSLPDPSLVDFADLANTAPMAAVESGAEESRLTHGEAAERRLALVDLLEEKIREKDRVIREQAMLLGDYKIELGRIKDEMANGEGSRGQGSLDRKLRQQRRLKGLVTPHPSRQPQRKTASSATTNEQDATATTTTAMMAAAVAATSQFRNIGLSRAAVSDGDDSWSEPDVTAARKRMGLTNTHLLLPSDAKVADSSETEAERKHKSFYALEYTGQDFSEDEEVEEEDADAYLDTLAFDDYSKIIQELQSHRKEIEKLQTDMGNGGLRSLMEEEDLKEGEQTEGNQVVGMCSQTAPGSLECILSGILDLYRAMDDLTYQIDVSDSFDSGNGSDDEEEDTEAETSRNEDIDISVCHICSQVVCKDVEHCLKRCSHLILTSTSSMRRLRRICYNLRARFGKTNDDLASQKHAAQQLEQSVTHLQEKVGQASRLEKELRSAKEELARRTKDLQETQVKMNDNYKLVAELSNENLKLTGDKVRAEEMVEDLKKQQSTLRSELCSTQRVLEQLNSSRKATSINTKQRYNSKYYPKRSAHDDRSASPEPKGAHDPYANLSFASREGESGGSVSALEMSPSAPQKNYSHHFQHGFQRGYPRGYHRKSGRRHRQRHQVGVGEEHPLRSQSSSDAHVTTHCLPTSIQLPTTLQVPLAASDISSPDLGVDVSSDPFSSLERTANPHTLLLTRPLATASRSGPLDAVVLENCQLRQDRDALMDKLVRSKSALKETLDRLTSSKEYKKESSAAAVLPSPLPPKKVLSSSAILSSVGSESSRSRVTQDLMEFSKTHGGGAGGGGLGGVAGLGSLGNGPGAIGYGHRRTGSRARKDKSRGGQQQQQH